MANEGQASLFDMRTSSHSIDGTAAQQSDSQGRIIEGNFQNKSSRSSQRVTFQDQQTINSEQIEPFIEDQ